MRIVATIATTATTIITITIVVVLTEQEEQQQQQQYQQRRIRYQYPTLASLAQDRSASSSPRGESVTKKVGTGIEVNTQQKYCQLRLYHINYN